jgi:hypothetical protein
MAKQSSTMADDAEGEEWADAEWDDFAQLLEDFRVQRANKGHINVRKGSKVMEELKFIGPKEPPADYIVYPSIYPGQNVEEEDDDMYFMPATNVVCQEKNHIIDKKNE